MASIMIPRSIPILLLLSCLGAFGACAPPPENPPSPADERVSQAPPAATYRVRALVRQLPDPESPGSQFLVRHEAIDDLVGFDGEVGGMDAMTMPFPLVDDGLLDGVEPGDKVTLVLEVDWPADIPVRVVDLEPLPDDTELEFRAARTPPGDPGDDEAAAPEAP